MVDPRKGLYAAIALAPLTPLPLLRILTPYRCLVIPLCTHTAESIVDSTSPRLIVLL